MIERSPSAPVGATQSPRPPVALPQTWGRLRRAVRDFLRRPKVQKFVQAAIGYFPLTWSGAAVLALSALAFWFQGVQHLDLVLLVAGITGASVTLLMAIFVGVAVYLLRKRLKDAATRDNLEMESGVHQPTGFEVQFPPWFPCVELRWDWARPNGRTDEAEVYLQADGSALLEMITPKVRGVYPTVRRNIAVRDALGLTQLSWRREDPVRAIVLPHKGRLEQLHVLNGLLWGDDISDPRGDPYGDRVDMRQYAHGDSPRMILWKVYARSRKLMVRIPERAITTRPRACAYLVAGDGDEPVAGLVRVVLEKGLLGEDWRFGADGASGHTSRLHEALDILAQSGNVASNRDPSQSGAGLAAFLQQAQKDGYFSCFLFVPTRPGEWMERVLRVLHGSPMRTTILLGTDHFTPGMVAEPRWKKFVFRSDRFAPPSSEEVAKVARVLAGSRCDMVLVDRAVGRVYRETKAFLVANGKRRA